MRLAASLLMTALLVSAPLACFAADVPDDAKTQVRVSFHDLNLHDTTDAKRLLDRIRSAALDACGASTESVPEYRAATAKSKCYTEGVESAVRQINVPLLSTLYDQDPSTRLAAR
jgi:UrcA family protein